MVPPFRLGSRYSARPWRPARVLKPSGFKNGESKLRLAAFVRQPLVFQQRVNPIFSRNG